MLKELPKSCQGCTKTGMEAIGCPMLPQVPVELTYKIRCGTAHYHIESLTTTGGKVLGPIIRSDKPTRVNDASGRARNIPSHSGLL